MTDGKKAYIGFNTCRLAIKVKAGTTGCNITCPEMDEVLTGASSSYHTGVTAADKKGLFEGEQSNPDKEYDANGDMYLTWYVQIPDVNSGFQDFNFTLTNQLNSENDYITHFKVIFKDIKLNPLWYIAKYNLNSDLTFNTTEDYSQGYLFNWSTIMGKGYTYSTSAYNGYALPSTPKTVSNGESGATWHLGTAMEWRSIIPVTSGMGTSSGILFTSRIASHIIYSETACTFGYDNTTKYSNGTDNTSNAGVSYTSYWSNITGGTRYAIRFIGTYYVSAWRYQIISDGTKSRLVISSRLVDPIEESELSTMLSTIQSTDESFWSEDEDQGVIQRVFYYTGHSNSEGNAPGANKTFNSNGTYYWNTSYNYNGIGFYYNDIYWENLTNCRVCARLFRDSQ